jgi:electron transfer flavoprotein alpha subunit
MPNTILVVAEQREGKLNRASLETVAAAHSIAQQTGWAVEVALPGNDLAAPAMELADALGAAAKVYAIESPALDHYTADAYVFALKHFVAEKQPKLVLFPHTYQVRDFAPRLALALDRALISDTTNCKYETAETPSGGKLLFTRQMFQGKFSADVSFTGEAPWLATIQIGAFRPLSYDSASPGPHSPGAAAGAPPVETVAAAVAESAPRVVPHEVFQEARQAVDLGQAEIIVAVGRGIKEQKNLAVAEALAAALGGEVAASRPICDNGWLPLDRQIGSSGQTVAPKLYIALGISGAIQHIVGMKGAGTIVAINKDAEAPIFEIADIGVVGNLFDIVPPLTEEIKRAKAGA